MKENEENFGNNESVEAASKVVTQAGNRTIEALKGHLQSGLRDHYEGVLQNLNGARAFLTKKGLLFTTELALSLSTITACAPPAQPVTPSVEGRPTATEVLPATPWVSPTLEISPTETSTSTPEPTPTPEIKQFKVCSKIENFRDCEIPKEDLLNGNYLRWLQTLSKPFDESKVKDVPFMIFNFASPVIIYDTKTPHDFRDSSTAPFRRDVTFGVTYIDYKGVILPYVVKPVEYFDRNDPTHNKWVITVDSFYTYNPQTGGAYQDNPKSLDTVISKEINIWKNNMTTTPIQTTAITLFTGNEDPFIKQVFDDHPDMQTRFQNFVDGDFSALSESGIILLTQEASGGTLFK